MLEVCCGPTADRRLSYRAGPGLVDGVETQREAVPTRHCGEELRVLSTCCPTEPFMSYLPGVCRRQRMRACWRLYGSRHGKVLGERGGAVRCGGW